MGSPWMGSRCKKFVDSQNKGLAQWYDTTNGPAILPSIFCFIVIGIRDCLHHHELELPWEYGLIFWEKVIYWEMYLEKTGAFPNICRR